MHSSRSLDMFNFNPTSTRMHPFAVCAVLLLTGLSPRTNTASAFTSSSPCRSRHRQKRREASERYHSMPKHSPLEDSPWQEEDSYYDRLREASKDPETFEKFVEDTMSSREDGGEKKSDDISSSEAIKFARGDDEGNSKKPKQYVPIEEWDKNNGDNMTKEERLQWECQRNGDQFRQNEILTQNLKRF